MDETSDQIEHHIRETRNSLSENFSELEDKVKTTLDWRAQFSERPGTMIALAVGGGALLAALVGTGSSRRRSRNGRDETDRNVPDVSDRHRPSNDKGPGQGTQTLNALKGALVGVAVTRLSEFIDDLIPGFRREFEEQVGKSKSTGQPSVSPAQAPWRDSAAAGD
jgi:hypothetical protein